jgi:SAM-dependent methyltransferase
MTNIPPENHRSTERRAHWERVYTSSDPSRKSWFQASPDLSLALIESCGAPAQMGVIDVGAGASFLVDRLLQGGFREVAVLDLSAAALALSRDRLGAEAERVDWYVSDVLEFSAQRTWGIWHDRAVFHFLTDPQERRAYRRVVEAHLAPGGHLLIATFAEDGPTECSGLDCERYGPTRLAMELGDGFELVETVEELHRTPSGGEQNFLYGHFVRR